MANDSVPDKRDLVTRLRNAASVWSSEGKHWLALILCEAADEIARLRTPTQYWDEAWPVAVLSTGRVLIVDNRGTRHEYESTFAVATELARALSELERLRCCKSLVEEETVASLRNLGLDALADRFASSKSPLEQRIGMVIAALAAKEKKP